MDIEFSAAVSKKSKVFAYELIYWNENWYLVNRKKGEPSNIACCLHYWKIYQISLILYTAKEIPQPKEHYYLFANNLEFKYLRSSFYKIVLGTLTSCIKRGRSSRWRLKLVLGEPKGISDKTHNHLGVVQLYHTAAGQQWFFSFSLFCLSYRNSKKLATL